MNIKRLWKQAQISIEDDSHHGEVVRVKFNQTQIAFPAHSSYSIRNLLYSLSETLGYTCTTNKKNNSQHEIFIK